jgi:hypothetical protein
MKTRRTLRGFACHSTDLVPPAGLAVGLAFVVAEKFHWIGMILLLAAASATVVVVAVEKLGTLVLADAAFPSLALVADKFR